MSLILSKYKLTNHELTFCTVPTNNQNMSRATADNVVVNEIIQRSKDRINHVRKNQRDFDPSRCL